MKCLKLQGLLWLYLCLFGFTALSLEPGYLDFDNLPDTNFTCVGKVIGGYYADLETNCQMFHVCTIGQADEPMDIRFLCLNGTVFDQETRVCERIDEVDCSKSEQFYSLNLELYGNSGPILEESPESAQETESPSIIIKSTSSTTTTTTTTKRPSNRPAVPPYYTTIRSPAVITATNKPKVVSTHHFPVSAPDIRFNPEEINISLNPGAPPDIRTKHFLPSFSDIEDIVNDNVNSDEQRIKVHKPERLHVSSSTSPKSIYSMDNINQKLPQINENNFGFLDEGYQTEQPQRQQQFLIQTNSFRHSQSFPPNIEHNANQYHHQHFHSTTAKQENNFHQDSGHTTLRTVYLHSLKPPEIHQHHHYTHHHHHHTEKPPQRVQIPIPLLPTLPPLTFSSPAPFTLQRHIESKRYTKDHPAPPRIIISASASVSDASGRRLNYSLGTIGAAQILKAPPASYDDYKDSDVGLDPFYHDVPKINQKRRKRRSTKYNDEKINPFDVIKNEKEAVEVLKFLFTWYQSHQATATVPPATSPVTPVTPVTPDLIHKINYELSSTDIDSDSSEFQFTKEPVSTESFKPKYANSELFKENGRYSIIGGYKNLQSNPNAHHRDAFRNSVSDSLPSHADRIRIGKNSQVDDAVTEIIPDLIIDKLEKQANKPRINNNAQVDESVREIMPDSFTKTIEEDVKKTPTSENFQGTETVTQVIHDTSSNILENYDDETRIVKTAQVVDAAADLVPVTSELKEKMDDSEVIVVKDLKAAYFNPYDYVDDNYEGVVYQQNRPKTIKENITVYTNVPKIEENNKNVTDLEGRIKFPVNPATITELHQLLNLNRNTTTVNTEDSTDSKNGNVHYDTTVNKTKEVIGPSEPLNNLTFVPNAFENLGESIKFTEINILSEVPNGNENVRNSSTMPTTSSTTTTEKQFFKINAIRRGRGRQRQYIDGHNNNQASFDSSGLRNNEKSELEGKGFEAIDKHNLKQENSTTRSQSRRGRKRGRSRFGNYTNFTSTTTESSTSQNVVLYKSVSETPTTTLPLSTLPILTEPTSESPNTSQILENSTLPTLKTGHYDDANIHKKMTAENSVPDHYKILTTNISQQTLNDFSKETTSEKSGSFGTLDNSFSSLENKHFESIDPFGNTKHDNVSKIHEKPKNDTKYIYDEIPKEQEKQFNNLVTKSYLFLQESLTDGKNIGQTISNYESTSRTDSEQMHDEISTINTTDESEERNNFTENKGPFGNTVTTSNNLGLETSTIVSTNDEIDHASKSKEALKILPKLTPVDETTEDPSYLIKLLRYYAETATTLEEESVTTKTVLESYAPLTESQATTTEKTSFPTYRRGRTKNRVIEPKKGRQRNEYRHSQRVRTSLPTLRDINEHLDGSKENGEKHENLKQSFAEDTGLINGSTPISTDHNTKLTLDVPDSELEENRHIKTESELIERLTLIEKNLSDIPSTESVTKGPIADTTATTPFISFELPESFGTTFSTITDTSKIIDDKTKVTKDITQIFAINTEPNQFFDPTERDRDYYDFYDNVFVVPELTENDAQTTYTETYKTSEENTEKTLPLGSFPTTTTGDSENLFLKSTMEPEKVFSETNSASEFGSKSSYAIVDHHETKTPVIIKEENNLNEPINKKNALHKSGVNNIQTDIEIQKSISLPVSVLETTFDISHDINSAQDINNLVSASPISESPTTLRTTEKLQEYIQEIEESTNSVVAKDDQIKLGFTEMYGLTATDTIPTTLITTEIPQAIISEPTTLTSNLDSTVDNIKYSKVPEVQHNATENLFVRNTESPENSENDSTTSLPFRVPEESTGMINSSHLLQVVVDTTTTEPFTTLLTTTRIPYHTRKTRPPKRRPYNNQKNLFGRHRFSTELFTNKPLKHNEVHHKQNLFTSQIDSENITDAPLHRSASPTRSEVKKVSLHTTPLSSSNPRFPTKINKDYVFNCFGKDKHKFYADPRDCRLFHYCTQGYSKNQLLDLKFVCDQKTFFDDDKLICTKVKPARCL